MASSITHFSHPHALVLKPSAKVDPLNGVICSFCLTGTRTGREVYACSSPSCGYILDPTCASLKKQELIPAHKQHVLDLVTSIPAPGTIFCNACGRWIMNQRYGCKTCDYDVHLWCAKLPEKLDSKFHEHTLYLHFPGPQRGGSHGLWCGQCGQGERGLWGYTCRVCANGFFLDLGCALAEPSVPSENPAEDLCQMLDAMQTVVDVANDLENKDEQTEDVQIKMEVVTDVENDQTSSDDDCDDLCELVCCCCGIS